MWVLTYDVKDYNQHGSYYQASFFGGRPDVTWLACYLKHENILSGESWYIREQAQKLFDGETVEMENGREYTLWEHELPSQLPMY